MLFLCSLGALARPLCTAPRPSAPCARAVALGAQPLQPVRLAASAAKAPASKSASQKTPPAAAAVPAPAAAAAAKPAATATSALSIDIPDRDIFFVPKDHFLNPPTPLPKSDPVSGWTASSQRCGLLGKKIGMLSDFDPVTKLPVPLTAIEVPGCYVTKVTPPSEQCPNWAILELGVGNKKPKRTPKPMLGHFLRAGVPARRYAASFRVTPNAAIPLGTRMDVKHFVPGQFVDVQGKTTGKGFQGPMKRWGFGGLPASHGVSVVHRSHGSTGNRQDPGRVFKGKKMAGHMGQETITVRNLQVAQVDTEANVIYVKGCVPGKYGAWLKLRDATWKPHRVVPPFPTHFAFPGDERGVSEWVLDPPGWILPSVLEQARNWVPQVGPDEKEKRHMALVAKKQEAKEREQRKLQSKSIARAKARRKAEGRK